MFEVSGQIGELIHDHRRTVTFRVVAGIVTAFVLPILWSVWVEGSRGIAAGIGLPFIGAVTLFFLSQGQQHLVVGEDGIQYVGLGGDGWVVRWSDLVGVFAVIHVNDLAKVSLKDRDGHIRVVDLNWRERLELESVLWEALRTYPPIPQPLYTPWGLGFWVGDHVRKLFRKNDAA